jgi:hypothetical protein
MFKVGGLKEAATEASSIEVLGQLGCRSYRLSRLNADAAFFGPFGHLVSLA